MYNRFKDRVCVSMGQSSGRHEHRREPDRGSKSHDFPHDGLINTSKVSWTGSDASSLQVMLLLSEIIKVSLYGSSSWWIALTLVKKKVSEFFGYIFWWAMWWKLSDICCHRWSVEQFANSIKHFPWVITVTGDNICIIAWSWRFQKIGHNVALNCFT